jgi:hypothetical protein
MAYEEGELEGLALTAIEENNLTKVSYISAYIPCSQSTFYDLGLEKSEDIKKALYENRIKKKTKLVDKWEASEVPVLQIAAFKLIAEEDELHRLTSAKYEVDNRNVNLNAELTEEEKKVELDKIKKGLDELNDY